MTRCTLAPPHPGLTCSALSSPHVQGACSLDAKHSHRKLAGSSDVCPFDGQQFYSIWCWKEGWSIKLQDCHTGHNLTSCQGMYQKTFPCLFRPWNFLLLLLNSIFVWQHCQNRCNQLFCVGIVTKSKKSCSTFGQQTLVSEVWASKCATSCPALGPVFRDKFRWSTVGVGTGLQICMQYMYCKGYTTLPQGQGAILHASVQVGGRFAAFTRIRIDFSLEYIIPYYTFKSLIHGCQWDAARLLHSATLINVHKWVKAVPIATKNMTQGKLLCNKLHTCQRNCLNLF